MSVQSMRWLIAGYQDVKFSWSGVGGWGVEKKTLKCSWIFWSHCGHYPSSLPAGLQDIKWPPLVAFRRGLQCWVLAVLDYSPIVGPQCGVQRESYLKLSSDYLALNKGPAFFTEVSVLIAKNLVCEDSQPGRSLLQLCLIIH